MRTTVRLNDELMSAVKRYAVERNATLTAIIEQALRELLSRRARVKPRKPVTLPTFKGRGLQPGVDLHNSAALLERMERRDEAP